MTAVTSVAMRSRTLCHLADVTYRQLDYLARATALRREPTMTSGSGTRRFWTRPVIIRVILAAQIVAHGHELLPAVFGRLLDEPDPPDQGWLLLTPDRVAYAADEFDLAGILPELANTTGQAVTILRYDVDAIAIAAGYNDLNDAIDPTPTRSTT